MISVQQQAKQLQKLLGGSLKYLLASLIHSFIHSRRNNFSSKPGFQHGKTDLEVHWLDEFPLEKISLWALVKISTTWSSRGNKLVRTKISWFRGLSLSLSLFIWVKQTQSFLRSSNFDATFHFSQSLVPTCSVSHRPPSSISMCTHGVVARKCTL